MTKEMELALVFRWRLSVAHKRKMVKRKMVTVNKRKIVTVNQLVFTSYLLLLMCYADIWRPFEPAFIKRVKSSYRDEWSFRTANTQRDALALSSDNDLKHEATHGDCVGLMPENPLHQPDIWFAGIETATNRMCIGLSQ